MISRLIRPKWLHTVNPWSFGGIEPLMIVLATFAYFSYHNSHFDKKKESFELVNLARHVVSRNVEHRVEQLGTTCRAMSSNVEHIYVVTCFYNFVVFC